MVRPDSCAATMQLPCSVLPYLVAINAAVGWLLLTQLLCKDSVTDLQVPVAQHGLHEC